MFFDDEFGKNKNYGDKKIETKEDFLKKMKKEEEEEKKKKLMQTIEKFFNKYIFISSDNVKDSKIISQLNSLKKYIEKNNFKKEKNEKLSIAAIKTVSDELLKMLNCRSLPNETLFKLLQIIADILYYTNDNSIKKLLIEDVKYVKIFVKLIKGAIFELYFNVKINQIVDKKNQIVNKKFTIFTFLYYLNYIFPTNTKNLIFKNLSRNKSFLYILRIILYNIHLLFERNNIGYDNKKVFFEFCGNISNAIFKMKKKNKNLELNYITYNFLDGLFINYLNNYFNDNDNIIENENSINLNNNNIIIEKLPINIFDFCCNLDINSLSYIKSEIPNKIFIQFFDFIISETNTNKTDNKNLNNGNYLFLFMFIFNKLLDLDLYGYGKEEFLIKINTILEYIFKSYQMKLDNNNNYKNFFDLLIEEDNEEEVKLIIQIIFLSTKLMGIIYMNNSEKKQNEDLYDYFINKFIIKYCPKINDIIINYALKRLVIIYPKLQKDIVGYKSNNNKIILLKETKEEKQDNENIFEVISFVILNQINYRKNFNYIKYQTITNICENLPFNHPFLNSFTYYLISLFNQIITKPNFGDIDMLSNCMIISCLKSLYLLDGDINFIQNKEQVWSNKKLESRLTKGKDKLLFQKIKLIPFIFPLKPRLDIGMKLKKNIKLIIGDYGLINYEILRIPRKSIFAESLIYYMSGDMKSYNRWIITFIDEFGNAEAGIDEGGLYREYIYKLSEEAFTKKEFFEPSQNGLLIPAKNSFAQNDIFNKKGYYIIYQFLGFIVGKAIFDNIKIYPNFSSIFLNNLLGIENSFIDLKEYDSELYKNLVFLKNYEGNVEDLFLNFSITVEENGKYKTIDLIENGNDIPVTNSNKLEYIKKVTDYYLTDQFKDAVKAFRSGIEEIISLELLKLYSGEELRQIIYGFDSDTIDIDDLSKNINYKGFNQEDKEEMQCIIDFFNILSEFKEKEKEKFLFFCTSLKRLPIGGFSNLNPKFTLHKSNSKMPTSSTCANMLHLPILTYNELKEKLLLAINTDVGFYNA